MMLKKHKVIIVGDPGVGKTALEQACLRDITHYSPNNIALSYKIREIENCGIDIWDIKDKSDCFAINLNLIRNIHLAILVFDVSNRTSFENLEKWIKLIIQENNLGLMVPAIIIGNKIDLRKTNANHVSTREGMEYADQASRRFQIPIHYVETSIVKDINIEAVSDLMYDLITYFMHDPRYRKISFIPE